MGLATDAKTLRPPQQEAPSRMGASRLRAGFSQEGSGLHPERQTGLSEMKGGKSSWGRMKHLVAQKGKGSACSAGDRGSAPGSGRPPGKGNGNPRQYSGLENPMDRGAWRATVHGVSKRRTRLSSSLSFFLFKVDEQRHNSEFGEGKVAEK